MNDTMQSKGLAMSDDDNTLDVVRTAYRAVGPLEAHAYFAVEYSEHLSRPGFPDDRMSYLAGRSSPMGAVSAGVITAAFYSVSPRLINKHVPEMWQIAAPADILHARRSAAGASLSRLLGDNGDVEVVAELAELLRDTCSVLKPHGRVLYAAHAEQEWPVEPASAGPARIRTAT